MAYDIYPAVDENYSFPPEIRQAMAASSEIVATMKTEVPPAVVDALSSDQTIIQAAIEAMSDASVIAELNFWRGYVTSSMNRDSLTTGVYGLTSTSNGAGINAPYGIGTLYVSRFGSYVGSINMVTDEAVPLTYTTRRNPDNTWTPWMRQDANYSSFALQATDNIDTLPSGKRSIWNPDVATSLGLPTASLGILDTAVYGNAGMQVWEITSPKYQKWVRSKNSGGWQPFERIDNGALLLPKAGSRGFKLIPLSVTAGTTSSSALQSATYRIPLKFNAPITRWQLCADNINVRSGLPVGSGIVVDGFYIGDHVGNGQLASTPSTIATNVTIPDDGTVWRSNFRTDNIGDALDKLLTYSYSSTVGPANAVAGAWRSTSKVATDLNPSTSRVPSVGLNIWIEAETYEDTPVFAVFGDSISIGASATLPLYDSVISQKCREIGALPVHWAVASDSMTGWSDPTHYKWTRWAHCDLADSALHAMSHNDAYGLDKSLPEMISLFENSVPMVESKISKNVYASTMTPRDAGSAEEHAVRNGYNSYIKGAGRKLVRDIFDFDSVISVNNTIKPEYNGDGIHLNTAGYKAESDLITRPVVNRTRLRFSEAAGRTATAWDHINQREQLIYGDTGERNIASLFTAGGTHGGFTLRRVGHTCTLTLYNWAPAAAGSGNVAVIPVGFRPGVTYGVPAQGLSSRIQVTGSGNVQAYNWTTSAVVASVVWVTSDPWPTSLPGIPA